MAAKQHAILSASSSDRWLHCPPSARLSESYEDKGSDYAAEGTDAHALAEYKLKKALGLPAEDPTENLSWYSKRKWRTVPPAMPLMYWNRSRPPSKPAPIRWS
jgi:hypothetical protein